VEVEINLPPLLALGIWHLANLGTAFLSIFFCLFRLVFCTDKLCWPTWANTCRNFYNYVRAMAKVSTMSRTSDWGDVCSFLAKFSRSESWLAFLFSLLPLFNCFLCISLLFFCSLFISSTESGRGNKLIMRLFDTVRLWLCLSVCISVCVCVRGTSGLVDGTSAVGGYKKKKEIKNVARQKCRQGLVN